MARDARAVEGEIIMNRGRTTKVVALAASLLLIAAACGDDDDADSGSAAATEAPATEAPATEAPATEAPSAEAPATEAPATEAPSTSAQPATGEPIKIGVLASSTGNYSGTETAILDGAQLLADRVNAAGGIDGRPIELVVGDYQSLVENASAVTQGLISDDDVVAIVGPGSSAVTANVEPLLGPDEVPMVSGAGANPTDPWSFAAFPIGGVAQLVSDFVHSKGYEDAFCVMHFPGPTGDVADKIVFPAFAREGLEVLTRADAQPDTQDFTPQVSVLKDAGCKVIWYEAAGTGLVATARAMKNLEMDAILATHGSNATVDNAEALGEDASLVYFYSPKMLVADQLDPSDPNASIIQDFVAGFEDQYSRPPITDNAKGYAMLQTVVDAMREVGVDGAAIRDWIETATIATPFATYTRDPENHNGVLGDSGDWAVFVQWDPESQSWVKAFG